MSEFFSMGGYAAYVWPCYILTFVVLGGLIIASRRGLKQQEEALRILDEEKPGGAAGETEHVTQE